MTKWSEKNWSQFYWGSHENLKVGSRPKVRVQITTSGATTDISDYLIGGAYIDMEKSRLPDEKAIVSSGDVMLSFSNHDGKFTEEDASSVFYGVTYIGYKIDIDFGFRKNTGATVYIDQAIMIITNVEWNSDKSACYISCRDILTKAIDFTLNVLESNLIPVAAPNTGNGYCSEIQTKPFVTVSEYWSIVCNLGGGSGIATFTVIGTLSGNIGTATSNAEFSNAAVGGIKFTVTAGTVDWAVNDTFQFSTREYPQFTNVNPAKIIWGLLTGFNYDSDLIENWFYATPGLDHTQSSANTDIDYSSFQTAVANLGTGMGLTGYVPYNSNASQVISGILIHFLGCIFANATGKIYLKTYLPTFGTTPIREFKDSEKIVSLKTFKNYDAIINSCAARYKKTASWAWSGSVETYDGMYAKSNANSITKYGEKSYSFSTAWISVNDSPITWAVDRIVDKYGGEITPPLFIEFITGLDAIRILLGDYVSVTDTKTGLSNRINEVYKLSKDFSSKPMHIKISCDDTGTTGFNWAFLGNSVDEGDGMSPQDADYDNATASDKQFCYLSQTGGEGSNPEYYIF